MNSFFIEILSFIFALSIGALFVQARLAATVALGAMTTSYGLYHGSDWVMGIWAALRLIMTAVMAYMLFDYLSHKRSKHRSK